MDEFVAEVVDYLDIALERTVGPALMEARKRPDLVNWDNVRMRSWLVDIALSRVFPV